MTDVRRLGAELGVRYVLEGSVSNARRGVCVSAMLIDTGTGVLVWVGRFDDERASHDVRDNVAAMLACNVAGAIVAAEWQRAMRASADQLRLVGGLPARHVAHVELRAPRNALAQSFSRRAIDLDPASTAGYSALGWSYMMAAPIFSQMTVAEGC